MRIALLDDYQEVALRSADWSPLGRRAQIKVFTDHVEDPNTLAERLADFDIVVLMRERTPFPGSLLARLPTLKLLVTTGMLNASIDLPAANRLGITVCGTNSSSGSAAELTWALLLALVRRVPTGDAQIRSGGWQTTIGIDLAGLTIGLLGLGHLGSRVARYAQAFDMNILAWSHNLTDETARRAGAQRVDKDELFASADVVSIHLRLSDRTRGLVGSTELALLGSKGYLINTSRGPIVDEAALIRALRSEGIAGAGLDVFDREPLPADHPLRSLPNTVLSPHVGYVTSAAYNTFYGGAVDDIVAWLNGAPVRVLSKRRIPN